MISLSPTLPGYLAGFSDIGTQKWFNYILNLSMDSTFNTTGSTQGNDYANGSEILYNGVSFAGLILPLAESVFTSTASFPTRRKKIINTNYGSGGARTGLFVKANFLLNKSMDAGTSTWGTGLQVTVPVEIIINQISGAAGFSAITTTCILKKVSTGGTITSLKTLTLNNTTTVGNINYYTYSNNTAIGSISADDVIYLEFTVTGTGGAHANLGDSETVSIITTGTNNLFASIP